MKRYFSFDINGNGLMFHDTAKEAKEEALSALDSLIDSTDYYEEAVKNKQEQLYWGELVILGQLEDENGKWILKDTTGK
jgi:hypothetical protein